MMESKEKMCIKLPKPRRMGEMEPERLLARMGSQDGELTQVRGKALRFGAYFQIVFNRQLEFKVWSSRGRLG